jgi:hypothetical protein
VKYEWLSGGGGGGAGRGTGGPGGGRGGGCSSRSGSEIRTGNGRILVQKADRAIGYMLINKFCRVLGLGIQKKGRLEEENH